MKVNLDITYTQAQAEVFFECEYRRRVIQKGGRLGFTRGGAQAIIEFMLDGMTPILWGDTTFDNIRKYYQQYFLPVLKQLGPEGRHWKMNWLGYELRVGSSVLHFRAAQKPENWEGFGYKLIFLNEAGIILKNPYLWGQAVRKMLLDFPDSILIAGGVPKGLNTFVDLIERGHNPKFEDWITLHYSTYDNPFISRTEIDKMVEEEPDISKQEVFGEIIDADDDTLQFIKSQWVTEAQERWKRRVEAGFVPTILSSAGNDPSGGGKDETVFSWRYGDFLAEQEIHKGAKVDSGTKVARLFEESLEERMKVLLAQDLTLLYPGQFTQNMEEKAKKEILLEKIPLRIDYLGPGQSVYDYLNPIYPYVVALTGSGPSGKWDKNRRYKIGTERTWWWWNMREILRPPSTACLPPDRELRRQLCGPRYHIQRNNTIQIEKKEVTAKRLKCSPDRGDSCVYAFCDKKKKGAWDWR